MEAKDISQQAEQEVDSAGRTRRLKRDCKQYERANKSLYVGTFREQKTIHETKNGSTKARVHLSANLEIKILKTSRGMEGKISHIPEMKSQGQTNGPVPTRE